MGPAEAAGDRRRLAVQILVAAELAAGIVLVSLTGLAAIQRYAVIAAAAWTPVTAGNMEAYVSSPVLWMALAVASFAVRFALLLRAHRADRDSLLHRGEAGAGDRVADALHGPELVDDHPA